MKLITNYMLDEDLRHKLNALTQKTFGFDFEAWVTKGYFEGDYIPFSYIEISVEPPPPINTHTLSLTNLVVPKTVNLFSFS